MGEVASARPPPPSAPLLRPPPPTPLLIRTPLLRSSGDCRARRLASRPAAVDLGPGAAGPPARPGLAEEISVIYLPFNLLFLYFCSGRGSSAALVPPSVCLCISGGGGLGPSGPEDGAAGAPGWRGQAGGCRAGELL